MSPHFESSKLRSGLLEDKIDVVEDQMTGWLFDHARFLASPANPNAQHAGFAILSIIGSYFEAIASYIRGQSSESQSLKFFAYGFVEVFPTLPLWIEQQGVPNPQKELETIAREYYKEVRCGLFHEAMTRGRVVIVSGDLDPLQMYFDTSRQVVRIQINPVSPHRCSRSPFSRVHRKAPIGLPRFRGRVVSCVRRHRLTLELHG